MYLFILKRLGLAIPTFVGISVLVFLMIHLVPGDPAQIMLGERADAQSVADALPRLRAQRDLGVRFINVQLLNHDTPPAQAARVAVQLIRRRPFCLLAGRAAAGWRTLGLPRARHEPRLPREHRSACVAVRARTELLGAWKRALKRTA